MDNFGGIKISNSEYNAINILKKLSKRVLDCLWNTFDMPDRNPDLIMY